MGVPSVSAGRILDNGEARVDRKHANLLFFANFVKRIFSKKEAIGTGLLKHAVCFDEERKFGKICEIRGFQSNSDIWPNTPEFDEFSEFLLLIITNNVFKKPGSFFKNIRFTIFAKNRKFAFLRVHPREAHFSQMDSLDYSGLVKTYNVDQQTPDSAGTATAYLCGVKGLPDDFLGFSLDAKLCFALKR